MGGGYRHATRDHIYIYIFIFIYLYIYIYIFISFLPSDHRAASGASILALNSGETRSVRPKTDRPGARAF